MYIYQRKNWTAFKWNNDTLLPLFANAPLIARFLGTDGKFGLQISGRSFAFNIDVGCTQIK